MSSPSNPGDCLTCCRQTEDFVQIIGNEDTGHESVETVLREHFWFTKEEYFERVICSSCWEKIDEFHKFYYQVKQIHKPKLKMESKYNSDEFMLANEYEIDIQNLKVEPPEDQSTATSSSDSDSESQAEQNVSRSRRKRIRTDRPLSTGYHEAMVHTPDEDEVGHQEDFTSTSFARTTQTPPSIDLKGPKVTNREQFNALLTFMENHPVVAKGQRHCEAASVSKNQFHQIVSELERNLNAHGPPNRTSKEWMKVWSDLRGQTKKKVVKEKKAIANRSKQKILFSHNEERCARLLHGRACRLPERTAPANRPTSTPVAPKEAKLPNPTPDASCSAKESTSKDQGSTRSDPVSATSDSINGCTGASTSSTSKEPASHRVLLVPSPATIFDNGSQAQTKSLASMANSYASIAEYKRKQYNLNVKIYDEKKEKLARQEKRKADKIKLKLELLDIKRKRLEAMLQLYQRHE